MPEPTTGDKVHRSPFSDNDSDTCKLIHNLMEKWHIPGASIAVIDGDDTWARGFGFATIDTSPATPSTLFYAASTTKAFTAAALAHLIDLGNLKTRTVPAKAVAWETPMHDVLLEDFVLMDDWATKHITIEDALCHRTGLPRHDVAEQHRIVEDNGNSRLATVKDTTRSLRHLPLSAEPRTKYQYCNVMFAAASHLVETLTGKWLGDVLKDWIWSPLHMHQTYFSLDDAEESSSDLATGYYHDSRTGAYKEVRHAPLDEVSGAGAVISSVLDYAKWIRCMIDEAKPLSRESHRAIKMPRIFSGISPGNFDAPKAYALGWEAFVYKGHRVWGHNGGTDSFGAQVLFVPDLRFGVVVFANTAVTSNVLGDVVSWSLVEDRLGISQDQRRDWEARWVEAFDTVATRRELALKVLYPSVPDPGLKKSLSLESYVGTYFHPGYKEMKLALADSASRERKPRVELVALRPDAAWPIMCEFEHVSGEYWLVEYNLIHNPVTYLLGGIEPAQFKLGPNGKVASMGIDWRNVFDDTSEGLIWFNRVD
ncbi:putative penicillin-binding protein [Lasiosphaeria hispida]|uniref:Penicillin-binding protein n=1 Tax=Lasiosphaeria hispida TaxID=260671 RepID=A0AAJ0HT57_9PEZI|nr:putative penicillin-binding protein [Lasiosphaeria hispida]